MRVVMVTPSATGGHPRYTWELMTALRAAAPPSELRLTLLTSVDLDAEFRTTQYAIADVLPPLRHASTFSTRLAWATNRAVHYARREEAVLRWVRAQPGLDVVHYQEPPFAAALHFARVQALGARPVATVHNLRPHTYALESARWVSDSFARLGWNRCATLFVHSAGLGDRLAQELGRRSPPIVPIPHGVWTGHGAGASCGGRRDGYLLLFGVMRRNKGVHLMLDALRHLPGRQLVLAGAHPEPSLAREVRARVESEKLNVVMIDRVIDESEIPRLFEGAALTMLPYTEFQGQSGVLHLALAYGVPAVVTDVGALGEEVRRQGIGRVSPEMTARSLASAVLELVEPSRYSAAREQCLELARTLSWSRAAQLTLGAYAQLERGKRS